MDDYSVSSLVESKNEWCARLVSIMTPAVIEGLNSIFTEAVNLCEQDDEQDKYLMTFQTFLKRIPSWNEEIIGTERARIEEESGCSYLEDLITCVHIIQLKALSCIRVAQASKKVDIDIPSVDRFVHKVYSRAAKKVYTNVYLFEGGAAPLQVQKNNRELEVLVRESILEAVRETMPIEDILKVYMAEQEETVENKEPTENANALELRPDPPPEPRLVPQSPRPKANFEIPKPIVEPARVGPPGPLNKITVAGINTAAPTVKTSTGLVPDKTPGADSLRISFDDTDYSVDTKGQQQQSQAPKTVERLERISDERHKQRKAEEAEEDEMKLTIGGEVKLELDNLTSASAPVKPPGLDIQTLF